MRILAISDVEDEAVTASLPARAGSIDLVLACGDLTYDYLDYVATAVAAPLRAVHGNHDVPPETLDDHEVQVWWDGIDLHGRVASIDGLLVGGLEGSPRYNKGPFQSSETDVWIAILRMLPALVMNRIRRGRFLDVLITHAPPRGIHAQAQRDGGLREVEIDQIVGSVGRYRDFDRAFLPRQVQTQDRWESVDRAYLDHTELPPVDLYKIGETYFVKDGNHRVSVARERGQSFIDAHVIEVTAPAPVDSVKDLLDFIRDQDALSFYEKTRISEMRPDARIELTLPGQYEKLLEHIATHQWYLGIEEKREVSYREAVASWYDRIYLPTVEAIRATGALRDFPHRSEADLYLWITEHHWYLHQAALPKGTELKELISEYADEHSERRPNPLSVIGRIPPVTAVRRRVSPRREESP